MNSVKVKKWYENGIMSGSKRTRKDAALRKEGVRFIADVGIICEVYDRLCSLPQHELHIFISINLKSGNKLAASKWYIT